MLLFHNLCLFRRVKPDPLNLQLEKLEPNIGFFAAHGAQVFHGIPWNKDGTGKKGPNKTGDILELNIWQMY